jgi:hypothetical protein
MFRSGSSINRCQDMLKPRLKQLHFTAQNLLMRRLSFKTQFKIEFLGPFYGPKKSLKKTLSGGSFIFDLHRKFLFLDFVARKRNIFPRPVLSALLNSGAGDHRRHTCDLAVTHRHACAIVFLMIQVLSEAS